MDNKCVCEYARVHVFSLGFMELLSGFSSSDEVHFRQPPCCAFQQTAIVHLSMLGMEPMRSMLRPISG